MSNSGKKEIHIVGVTGTLGAGKGEVVEYLKTHGFVHFSARSFILEEVKKRGLVINRDTTTDVANNLREMHGPSYIIASLYRMAIESGRDAVIESVRTVGEVEFLREQPHFILFAVDADAEIRYERAVRRRSELDHVTFAKFLADERREMNSSDPTKGNLAECIRRADHVFMNNGTREELYVQVKKVLNMPK